MLFIIVLLAAAEVSAKIPRKCPKPTEPTIRPDCGENAYFELCSNPCPPQNCSTLWTRYKKCPETCCKPACRCNDGYLRDDVTGRCIKRDECLAPCGPKEHYVTSSTNCQKTCANYKVTCPGSMCKPYTGCVCNDGRVRVNDDGTGDCILPELCPPRQCPVNEHWNDCPSVCLKETCISKSPDFQCLLPAIPLPCKPRCICDDGYLRDEYGNCIPENHCTIKSCPINEVWRCSSLCARDSCASHQPTFECSPGAPSSVCVPACECVSGYLRDDTGVCVPEDLCPEKSRCGINEIAVPNATVCPPQTCESIYTLYRCLENIEVKPGCDCRKGYLRNKLGTCVPSDYCPVGPPQECGPNQVYKECGSSCGTSCNDLNEPRQACTDQCVEGCFCNDGYYMDEEGNCVPPGECPLPECTGPNEVALECGSYCDVKTCDDQNRTDIVCPAVCVRGCFCFDGYVRNAYGVCVLPEDCPVEPVCLQENEEYQSCGSSCPDNCNNYLDTSRICTMQCVAGCNCKPGYVRRLEDKRCVLPEECPNKECTGLNEALNYCASYCPVTCANRFTQGDMACATVCRIGCDCIPGTLRNDTGVCVPTEECTPPVCRQNERYQNCGTACPLTCENINNPPQVCTDQCIEDCFCEEGYVRDRNWRCVKPSECEPICPPGEKYSPCSAHCQDTCDNYGDPNRICTRQCQSGCVCETGTVRANNGQCVKPEQCKPTCPPGETFDECSAHCQDTCDNYKNPNRICTYQCQPGCVCNKGTVRGPSGECVKPDTCPQCPSNERWIECLLGFCSPKTCDELGYPIACPDIAWPCAGGCICKENEVRNSQGICIPDSECPSCGGDFNATKGCGINCGRLCSNYDKPNDCATLPLFCNFNGCDCKEGYVFDELTEKCILPCDCPKPCNGDIYAEWVECPNPCPKTCAKPNPGVCNKMCLKGGCQCRQGYILGPNGKCIKPENCPADLGCNGDKNAIVRTCPNPCQETCEQRGPRPCPAICLEIGCECKPGFVLSKKGKCIKPEECGITTIITKSSSSASNQQSASSNLASKSKTVSDGHSTVTSSEKSSSASSQSSSSSHQSSSKKITRVTRSTDCIPPPDNNKDDAEKCDEPCSDPNAIRKKCASAEQCRPTCTQPTPGVCPKICIVNGCECKPGFVLSKKGGKCIKPEECPQNSTCNGDPNALIRSNPRPCPSTCEIPNGQPGCKKLGPLIGCECKPGYLLSEDNGKCILPGDCKGGDPCGRNATFVPCKVNCPNNNCPVNDNRGIIACSMPYPCYGGCACKLNYRRVSSAEDRCILASECPPVKCTRQNEVWSPCPSACLRENCEDIDNQPTTCNTLVLNCQPQCICKKGHFRNDKGLCVPAKQCPTKPTCSALEVYDPCSAHCEPTCENHSPNRPCAAICLPGCKCIDGLVRRQDGRCVKLEECSPQQCKKNEVYTDCGTACPATCDNRGDTCTACTEQCVAGCFCSPGLVRAADGSCIKPEKCPPRTCSGQNEEFVECPPTCPPTDGCSNIWSKFNCTGAPDCCKPQCRCKSEYFRNDKGICVTSGECTGQTSPCSDPNAERVECAPVASCRPTCANPNPGPCTLQCELNECVCKSGYVLSKKDGTCIKPDQCPIQESCNGDQNAVIKECPLPCPATCEAPNAVPCRRACQSVGCQCKDGYILSESREKCIRPDQCEGGNPCGRNETFVSCRVNCPSDSCPINDSPNTVNCETPSPCYPGCVCKINYRRRSTTDRQCIYASECPPVKCTRQNEVWSPCPSACLAEDCSDVNAQPVVCNTLLLNCQPKCICKKNHFRNDDGLCVPANQCPNKPPIKCKKNEVYSKCKITCPPQLCSSPYTDYACPPNPKCVPGCDCISEYLRNGTVDDECIPSSQCPGPQPVCGSNEHYETNTNKCQITCENMAQESCMGACETTSACFCDDGYVRNKDGVCIKKKECLKKCATGKEFTANSQD